MHWPAVTADMIKLRLFEVPPKGHKAPIEDEKNVPSANSHG
jgi:hypothetical protein